MYINYFTNDKHDIHGNYTYSLWTLVSVSIQNVSKNITFLEKENHQ